MTPGSAIPQTADSQKSTKNLGAHPTDDRYRIRVEAAVTVVFAMMSVLGGLQIWFDLQEAHSWRHTLTEEALFGCGFLGVMVTGVRLVRSVRREHLLHGHAVQLANRLETTERMLRAEADELAARLEATEAEARRWKAEAGGLLAGLGAAIDSQFDRWGLSRAERDVALLLLKGLSHKEVAQVRHVGESTVRQQAQALYRKAGISNRNDLAAFFLEDLLLPPVHPQPVNQPENA